MPRSSNNADPPNPEIYAILERLDKLEEVLEDLDELGVQSRAEVEARIVELNQQLDRLESAEDQRP